MQLTRAADYAIRVMMHLASLPLGERVLLPALAEATETPESFLSKVLQALARAGLIDSRRGKTGGFVLLESGRNATMRQIVEAIDGPIVLNLCLNCGRDCDRKPWCQAHPVWKEAQQAMLAVLDSAIVADLAERGRQARLAEAALASSPLQVL